MPYRRLPNTDVARLRALKIAYIKGKEIPPFKLAYSSATYTKVQAFLPQFEHALVVHKNAYTNQIAKSKDYLTLMKKAKLYISHFIQVVNMAIQRGDLSQNIRSFYKLEGYDNKVPQLNTENEIIKWGEYIINGEMERTRKGMTPITNPTIALVKVRFEDFKDAYNFQKTLQKNNSRTLQDLAKMRSDADALIAKLWDEVEGSYNQLPDEVKREKSREYGLIYVFRKNELRHISVSEESFEEVNQ
jgi:hypothetical protein